MTDGSAPATTDADAAAPLVSVVIPTYYRNDRLAGAIESVHEQSHDATEVIVVDGSEDGRAEAVAEDGGARYVHQGEDGGAHVARSMGAEAAAGDYVNFLDDDDRFFERKLERQLAVHREEPDVGVVYSGIEWDNGHPVLPNPDVRGDVLEYALKLEMTPSSPSTMLIDAAVLEAILPLANTHGADDMGMKIELAQRTEFEFVDEPLVRKGYSDDSLGGSQENIEGRFELLERYADLYEQRPDRVRRTALGHTYLLDAERELQQNTWSLRAIQRSVQAWWTVPGMPPSFTGYMFASVFGLPGRNYARKVYAKYFLGDEHRGKVT